MRAVNLLPRDAGQRSTSLPSTPVLVGVCAGVLVIAGLGGDYLLQSSKVAKEKQQLSSLQAQVRALPPVPAGPTPAQTQLASEHSARVTALSAALTNRVSWDRVFRELSLVLPDDVWLTTLTAHAPVSPASAAGGTAAGGAPSGFTMSGYTYSQDGVARLLSRLQVIPDLEHVTLVSSTLSQVSNQDVVQFQIVADIRTSGSSSS
jgi:Tfp pilus assembly protein PilN